MREEEARRRRKAIEIAEFPFSGHVLPEIPLGTRREVPYRGYRVIYRLWPTRSRSCGWRTRGVTCVRAIAA